MPINELLSLPFVLKVATRDWHPANHISFASSHLPPNNKAFESYVSIQNPSSEGEERSIPIWPSHCVENTPGAEIVPEIDLSKIDIIVDKGRDERLEMFSGFADVFGGKTSAAASHDLAELLTSNSVTHVFTVGLAGDHCVKCTALDANKEGFDTFVVAEAVKSVNQGPSGWGATTKELETAGVRVIQLHGPEVARVKSLI